LIKKIPVLHLVAQTIAAFLPAAVAGVGRYKHPAPWISLSFAKHYQAALQGYEARLKMLGPLPSFQENIGALDVLRRQISCSRLSVALPYEKRYPYLDRDLLEFIFAIPRQQILRPAQRRSLQRRSLAGIVPVEILNRKRKAFVTRGPVVAVAADWDALAVMCQHMASDSFGIVDSRAFHDVLQRARRGQEIPVVPLLRTLTVEYWLRHLKEGGLLKTPSAGRYVDEPRLTPVKEDIS
jgi:asparagine synthase (glutamine-hydrolysing)